MTPRRLRTTTRTTDETRALAARLGPLLRPGDVVALTGDLGTGKTTFVQGLAHGLGVVEPVVSPTFTIVREYQARNLRLVHVDVYRLERIQELHDIGFDDLLDDDAVVVIEWADAVASLLPQDRLAVVLDRGDTDTDTDPDPDTDTDPDADAGTETHRTITVEACGTSWAARLEAIEAALAPGAGEP